MAASQQQYSTQIAYHLGDEYKGKISTDTESQIQSFLTALLCYTLPTIPLHPLYNRDHIQQQKLFDLGIIRQQRNISITPKIQKKIPPQIKRLLKGFYKPWLDAFKQNELKERATDHSKRRADAIMDVFNGV